MGDTDFGLDSVRVNEGADKCKAVFAAAVRRGPGAAAALLNETRTYPTLFILIRQIKESRLYPYLGPRRRAAYLITNQILNSADKGLLSEKSGAEHEALRWMIETGRGESLGGEYDEVIDVASSVLLNLYRDKSVLPLVADIIFARGREGRNIHDLAWAFFRSRDPEALKIIARRVDSDADSGLARSLLGARDAAAAEGEKRGEDLLKWLEENEEYLYFTDECFQLKSRPLVYGVDLERKYLQRGNRSYARRPVAPAFNEGEALAAFRQLKGSEQAALSEYSHKLGGDKPKWRKWMALPISEQLKQANSRDGV